MSDNRSTRRDFLRTVGIGAAGVAGVGPARFGGPFAPALPNFVFILADDLGYPSRPT